MGLPRTRPTAAADVGVAAAAGKCAGRGGGGEGRESGGRTLMASLEGRWWWGGTPPESPEYCWLLQLPILIFLGDCLVNGSQWKSGKLVAVLICEL